MLGTPFTFLENTIFFQISLYVKIWTFFLKKVLVNFSPLMSPTGTSSWQINFF